MKLELLSDGLNRFIQAPVDYDINSKDKYGSNLLYYYIMNGKSTVCPTGVIISKFIKKGLDINEERRDGCTALHLPVQYRLKGIFELLLNRNAGIDMQNANGNTLLWEAVMQYKGDGFFIEHLLKNGANPDIENDSGVSPRSLVRTIANHDVRRFFSNDNKRQTDRTGGTPPDIINQRNKIMMEIKDFPKGTKPKEIFIYTYEWIVEPLIPLGYKYHKSRNDIIKKDSPFTFGFDFQPSIRFSSICSHARSFIESDVLLQWRKRKYNRDDCIDSAIIDTITRLTRQNNDWKSYWVDAFMERERVVKGISDQINRYALPPFERFPNLEQPTEDVERDGLLPHWKKTEKYNQKRNMDFVECLREHCNRSKWLITNSTTA